MKNVKKLLSACTALLCAFVLGNQTHAQSQTNRWHMGSLGSLNFVNNNPVPTSGSRLVSNEGSASISDNQGNLLFYTNGERIWNRRNAIMANGDDLQGSQNVTQGALIVPRPGNANRYFVFTIASNRNDLGLRYSEVDMALDNGDGAVIANRKNIPLLAGPITDKLTATRHCNGNDYWILARRFRSNQFVAYLLTDTGLVLPGIVSSVGAIADGFSPSAKGYMRFSPDGKKIAAVQNHPNTSNVVEVFDFNRSTGAVTNAIRLPAIGGEYGVVFSPDNSKLYVGSSVFEGTEFTNTLVQYDFMAPSLVGSRQVVISKAGEFSDWGALTLGPDKKIYIVQRFWDLLHGLNNPNQTAANTNYQDGLARVANATLRLGVPNFIDNDFYEGPVADFNYQLTCALEPVRFRDSSRTNISSFLWNFGDPASPTNSSTARNPSHTFSAPGNYKVSLTVDDGCGRTNTIEKEVVVPAGFDVDLGFTDTVICFTNQITLESNVVGDNYTWFTGTGNPPQWTANGNTNRTQVVDLNNAGRYRLEVTQGLCQGSDDVFIEINNTIPTITVPSDLLFCELEPVTLDAGNPGASFVWSTGDTTQTTQAPQTGAYTVTVTNRGCSAQATYDVVIDDTPLLTIQASTTQICIDDTLVLYTSYGYPTGLDIVWSNGQTRDSIYIFGNPGTYSATYITPLGCERKGEIVLTEKCKDRFFAPTVFSPNGDGVNDFFKPLIRNVDKLEMYIYDRWGKELYRSNSLDAAWDGKYNGKYVPESFYVWIIKWTNPEYNTFRVEKGYIYVID